MFGFLSGGSMQFNQDDVIKGRLLIKHLNKAYFKEISTAEVVEVSGLLIWFGKSIEASQKDKPAKVSKISKGKK